MKSTGAAHKGWLAILVLMVSACSDESGSTGTASTVEPSRTADFLFDPVIDSPAWSQEKGPVVCIDETHNNFHTSLGTYRPFAEVLRLDGHVIRRFTEGSETALSACDILVIADAQPPATLDDPPTFSSGDVAMLLKWVESGGGLFLITDHLPDPGAIEELAAAFDVEVHNGYVLNESAANPLLEPLIFSSETGTLGEDALLLGRGPNEEVTTVATFLGTALRGGEHFRSLLLLPEGLYSWAPEVYYNFQENTPRVNVGGWSQGGVQEVGEGRMAIFGEASMFTAQVFNNGATRVGMNSPQASHNLRLLLNLTRWLGRHGE